MVSDGSGRALRDSHRARAIENEYERNRARRIAAEQRIWEETGAAYAAEQAHAATDDVLKPPATRRPDFTPFTDKELEDF